MSVQKEPNLLAKQGDIRGYATKLGAYFHIDTKEIMRKLIALAYKKQEKVIKWKLETGWTKDHVAADIESFEFIKSLMLHPLNDERMSGWKDENDPNCVMLQRLTYMKALVQDEDSYYDLIELVRLKWVHENWERYEQSANAAYNLVNFPNFYKHLLEHKEVMEEPLPDITDEPDYAEPDYIKLEEGIKNGLERKG